MAGRPRSVTRKEEGKEMPWRSKSPSARSSARRLRVARGEKEMCAWHSLPPKRQNFHGLSMKGQHPEKHRGSPLCPAPAPAFMSSPPTASAAAPRASQSLTPHFSLLLPVFLHPHPTLPSATAAEPTLFSCPVPCLETFLGQPVPTPCLYQYPVPFLKG